MAKKGKSATSVPALNRELLKKIVEATNANSHIMVTQDEATPLMNHQPPLIVVNTDLMEGDKAAARATPEGIKMIVGEAQSQPAVSNGAFQLMKGVELPASRRGQGLRGGRTNKYPFDQMAVGDSFFVPVSEDTPEPLKTLGSTVSSANMRYAEETGQQKEVTRVKRGPDRKAMKDANGNKVTETVNVPVYNFTRKYEIRGVKGGQMYGTWAAPSDGVLIARTK